MAGALVTTNILQTLVSMGLNALRERIVLAKVVNRDVEGLIVGAKKGSTVNVAIPATVATRAVQPDVVPPAVTAVTPTSIPVTLSEWREAVFAMDDKGLTQVDRGILPMQASEAIRALANYIDAYLWSLVHNGDGFYGYAGVAGTTPFTAGDLSDFLSAGQQADAQLMPVDNRFMILDTFAKSNALSLAAVQNASWRGSPESLRTGNIGELLGATWDFSQNVPQHTSGTAAGATTDAAGYAVGVETLTLAAAGAGDIHAGDIFTIAGDDQPYIATAAVANVAAGGALTFAPALKVAIAAGATAITLKATHRVNLLIHRDAVAFAMAPLVSTSMIEGVSTYQAVAIDNDSGLALRLEVTRQHRQDQWAFDALFGGKVVRRELGVRLAG